MSFNQSIKIGQWNSRGLLNKSHLTPKLTREFDILLLSETKLTKNKPYGITNMKLHRKDRASEDRGGGVAIGIKNDITWFPVDLDDDIFNNEHFEVACVFIQLKENKKLFCVSIYKPPQFNITEEEWTKLLERIKMITKDSPVIIGGDLNTKHELWGSAKPNASGKNLVKALPKFDLQILNNGKHTRYDSSSNTTDVMDLTLVNTAMVTKSVWDVTDWEMGSDHSVITIQINNIILKGRAQRPGLNTRNTDWDKFKTEISNEINRENFIENDHLKMYTKVCQTVIKTVKICGGKENNRKKATSGNHEGEKHQEKKKKTPKSWWNEEICNTIMDKRSDALKKLKEDNTAENRANYQKVIVETQKELKKVKRDYFNGFITSINPSMNHQKIWKTIRKYDGTNTKPNTTTSEKKKEQIQSAINKLSDPVPDTYEDPKPSEDAGRDAINNIWFPISVDEVKTIIKKLKKISAAGPDLISNIIIKNLPEDLIKIITHIFNRILETGETPKEWRTFDVCLVPKPGNTGLRPISLASCLMKVFERAFMNRFEYFLETELILPITQYGFRKLKSCLDNLAIFTTDIKNAFATRQIVGAAFIDIEGAYDNVRPEILIKNLEELRLPKRVIKVIANLIGKRQVKFYDGGELIEERTIIKGLPQGCVLSPALFNVYVRKINDNIGLCGSKQFADDWIVYTKNENVEDCIEELNSGLDKLNTWVEDLGMKISKKKTKFVLFNRRKNMPPHSHITIGNTDIGSVSTVMFLGTTLDSKLNWKAFTEQVKNNINKSTSILRTLTRKSYGIHPSTALTVFQSLVMARAEWAGFCSASACKTNKETLTTALNVALRCVLGCYPSTPINIMWDLAGQPSLELRIEKLTGRYIAKAHTNKKHPLTPKLAYFERVRSRGKSPKYCESFISKVWQAGKEKIKKLERHEVLPCYEYPLKAQLDPIKVEIERGKKIKSKEIPVEEFEREIMSSKPEWNIFYTDGSLKEGEEYAGLAVINKALNLERRFKINSNACIFEAEAMAIIQTLKIIKNSTLQKSIICTDSLSTIQALNSVELNGKTHEFILEIKSLLSRIKAAGRKVEIWFSPGHVGIPGNERADKAANRARLDGKIIEFKYNLRILNNELEHNFKKVHKAATIKAFEKKSKTYAQLWEVGAMKPWFHKLSLPRRSITLINRIRANHICTGKYLHMIKKKDDCSCPCGHKNQDLNHIFWGCEITKEHANKLEQFLKTEKKENPPWEIRSLAFSQDVEILANIVEFIYNIKDIVDLTHSNPDN